MCTACYDDAVEKQIIYCLMSKIKRSSVTERKRHGMELFNHIQHQNRLSVQNANFKVDSYITIGKIHIC